MISLMCWNLKQLNSQKQIIEWWLSGARGWEMEINWSSNTEFQLCKMNKFWRSYVLYAVLTYVSSYVCTSENVQHNDCT